VLVVLALFVWATAHSLRSPADYRPYDGSTVVDGRLNRRE
jgi:hypothetical protein